MSDSVSPTHGDNIAPKDSASKKRLLEVANLSVSLGESTILQDISFSLSTGEFVAIVGPNGAGKTTLLRTLLGALPPQAGVINLSNQSAEKYSNIERAKFMSYVPQAREVPAGFGVREFVEMGFYSQGYRYSATASIAKKAKSIISATDLSQLSERRLETLSGGELQRVYLAAALAQDAQIMLLDEPTTFLDPAHQRQMVSILSNSRLENKSLSALIVTHDLNLAVSFADRILTFKDGVLVFDGSPDDFCDEKRLQDIYQTKMRFLTDPHTNKKLILPELIASEIQSSSRRQR